MKSGTSLADYGRRIVIKPGSSHTLILLITTAHVLALLLLYFVDINTWLLLSIAGLIVFNLFRYIVDENRINNLLSLQPGGPLLLKNNRYTGWQNVAVTESFVTHWIIVLRVRALIDSKKYSLIYVADSINNLSHRHLAIYLNRLRS